MKTGFFDEKKFAFQPNKILIFPRSQDFSRIILIFEMSIFSKSRLFEKIKFF